MDDDPEFFGIRAAGRRVHRSRMTIHRWEKAGMRVQIINGRKQIACDDLLAMYRQKIQNERRHQFKRKAR